LRLLYPATDKGAPHLSVLGLIWGPLGFLRREKLREKMKRVKEKEAQGNTVLHKICKRT
jgi:hypothetical protein